MPLAISTFFGSPDLDGLDVLGTQVGVATSITTVGGGADFIVSGSAFSGSLDLTTSGDITDVPMADFNGPQNVISYNLDSASQGTLPPGGEFGGKVIGWDATDQIYLVDQYNGFTPIGGTPPDSGTFVSTGLSPNHFELVGLCNGSGVENAATCPGGDALTLDQQFTQAGGSFTFAAPVSVVAAPEPASGSIIAAALGIAFCVGRMKQVFRRG